MRLSPVTLAAAGDSPWIVPGPRLMTPTVALALTFSYNANLTASVYYTYDDTAQNPQNVTLAWAANVLTVTTPTPHNLNVADVAEILNSASGSFTGSADVATVPSSTTFTLPWTGAGLPANDTAQARLYLLFEHPTLKNLSGTPPTRLDGVLSAQVGAFRLTVSGYTVGSATLYAQQGDGR